MACECVSCGECDGTGTVWFAFPGPDRAGEYLGNHRCDDLDEMDSCMECGGSGIVETCYECQDSQDGE
jgi:hypothetical protein